MTSFDTKTKTTYKSTTLEMVEQFHDVYSCVLEKKPNISNKPVNDFRVNFLQEELDELKEALENNDLVEVLDALTDLQYVLDGTYLSFGLQKAKNPAFDEVHRSNMSKLDEDGNPIVRPEDGKILKGPNYFKPDLKKILAETYPELNDKEAA